MPPPSRNGPGSADPASTPPPDTPQPTGRAPGGTTRSRSPSRRRCPSAGLATADEISNPADSAGRSTRLRHPRPSPRFRSPATPPMCRCRLHPLRLGMARARSRPSRRAATRICRHAVPACRTGCRVAIRMCRRVGLGCHRMSHRVAPTFRHTAPAWCRAARPRCRRAVREWRLPRRHRVGPDQCPTGCRRAVPGCRTGCRVAIRMSRRAAQACCLRFRRTWPEPRPTSPPAIRTLCRSPGPARFPTCPNVATATTPPPGARASGPICRRGAPDRSREARGCPARRLAPPRSAPPPVRTNRSATGPPVARGRSSPKARNGQACPYRPADMTTHSPTPALPPVPVLASAAPVARSRLRRSDRAGRSPRFPVRMGAASARATPADLPECVPASRRPPNIRARPSRVADGTAGPTAMTSHPARSIRPAGPPRPVTNPGAGLRRRTPQVGAPVNEPVACQSVPVRSPQPCRARSGPGSPHARPPRSRLPWCRGVRACAPRPCPVAPVRWQAARRAWSRGPGTAPAAAWSGAADGSVNKGSSVSKGSRVSRSVVLRAVASGGQLRRPPRRPPEFRRPDRLRSGRRLSPCRARPRADPPASARARPRCRARRAASQAKPRSHTRAKH